MKKRTKIILLIISFLTIGLLIGFSYALSFGKIIGPAKRTTFEIKDLTVSFDGGTEISSINIDPGTNITKVVTVSNSSENSINYDLSWDTINSTFINNELVYSVECKRYSTYISRGSSSNVLSGTCNDFDNEFHPLPKGTHNIGIINNTIENSITHEYTITVSYVAYNDMTTQNVNSTFNGKIYISDDPVYETTFKDKILSDKASMLVNAPVTTPIDSINNVDEANLVRHEVSPLNYTYYFRGNVTNNYVSFGGFFWKIIRINEDGSVRMIYNGTSPDSTGNNCTIDSGSNYDYQTGGQSYPMDITYIGYMTANPVNKTYGIQQMPFTDITRSNDQIVFGVEDDSHSGYTYDETTGYFTLQNRSNYYYDMSTFPSNSTMYTCGSTTEYICNKMYKVTSTVYKNNFNYVSSGIAYISHFTNNKIEAESNEIDGLLKTKIDSWYSNNLINYTGLLSDSGFCNDRRITINSYAGYGAKITQYYSYYYRTVSETYPMNFDCPVVNDNFTVNNINGNRKLIYPIGMITAAEVIFAGGRYSTANANYHLYNGSIYYTISPYVLGSNALLYTFAVSNIGTLFNANYNDNYRIRPVINVDGNLFATGTGISTDPYVINYSS